MFLFKNTIYYILIIFSFFSLSGNDLINGFSIQNSNVDKLTVKLEDLEGALQKSYPGDTIFIKNGIYSNINLTLKATPASNIYIIAQTRGKVVINGKSTISIHKSKNLSFEGFLFEEITNPSAIILNSSSNILIKDNYFLKCGVSRFGFILRIDRGSFDNNIFGNTFDGSKAMSVVVTSRITNLGTKKNKNNIIENNYFVNILSVKTVYPNSDGNGMEAIQIGQGIDGTENWPLNTIVKNNLFEKIRGDGGEIISIKSSNNQIINNTFLNNKSGITIRLGSNNSIKFNFLKETIKGIRVFGYGQIVEGNIIINPEYGIQLPTTNYLNGQRMKNGGYFQQENVTIENNYILNPSKYAFYFGNGKGNFTPKSVDIKKNHLIINNNLKMNNNGTDFSMFFNTVENEVVINQLLDNSNTLNNLEQDYYINNNLAPNITYFFSNDSRVGAQWRRPK